MELDKEQRAKLTFLSEAETYFEQIEAVVLSLEAVEDRPSQLNIAMRAAHSVKGAAGMMGFTQISQAAHHLEESFKILQARDLSVDDSLSTLLLQGIDCLRAIRLRRHQGKPVESAWLASHVDPVFDRLQQQLGELTPKDEARLLSAESDEDLDVVVFTTTVEDYLEEFADSINRFSQSLTQREDLRQALIDMASRLAEIGQIAQLKPFVELCRDVQRQGLSAPSWTINELANQTLNTWQRSHSLVMLGRKERLPTRLGPIESLEALQSSSSTPAKQIAEDLSERAGFSDVEALTELAFTGFGPQLEGSPVDIDQLQVQLSNIQTQLDTIPLPTEPPVAETAIVPVQSAAIEPAFAELGVADSVDLDSVAVDPVAVDSVVADPVATQQLDDNLLGSELANEIAFDDVETTDALEIIRAVEAFDIEAFDTEGATQPEADSAAGLLNGAQIAQPSTVRVSVDQLREINSLFESLVLNRNAISLRLEQLQSFSALMQERMMSLASFNTALRQWYDQASTTVPTADQSVVGTAAPITTSPITSATAATAVRSSTTATAVAAASKLDALELDSYSKLHRLAQENMETIVKLEEVSLDIDIGISEMGQAVGDLGYTSRALKTQITQAQMRSFREVVDRFPRVVRDWSVRYNKPITLDIEGENTLLEQFTLDQLSDPLMHLLRNAFDHGIESSELRQRRGKPAAGRITLRAVNRGNRVVITLNDDGNGIDIDKVRDRIREYDIPDHQIDAMERQELLSFLFEPGFSTRDEVTELSGRGFGMDVVNNNLRRLQGDIQVDTEPEKGTTFTLNIPLSLSILRVMLLERKGLVFALSIDAVQEMVESEQSLDSSQNNPSLLHWQDRDIPLVCLESYWRMSRVTGPVEMTGTPSIDRKMVVVVGEKEQYHGIEVDRFWKEQEVAIRPVASPIPLPPGFSGTTVLGDGRVVPLIDPVGLVDWLSEASSQQVEDNSRPRLSGRSDDFSSQSPSASKRVLIVDDSIHARRYLAISLEREGYLVEQSKDGREAVDKLLAGLAVDMIICDVEMPRLDGYGVLEELREQSAFRKTPIVMLTSRSGQKHRKLAMNLGATDYFSKPYNEQALLGRLRQLAGKISRA
mgnify:CR=1 FL=1